MKDLARTLITEHEVTERRACKLVGISRSHFRYRSQKNEDPDLIKEILLIKERHPYYGVPRVHAALRRKDFVVNGKKVYRLLKTLNLLWRREPKRKKLFIPHPKSSPDATHVGKVWAMDFVFDRLNNGEPFRCFTIVDLLSRQTPGILASKSMAGFSPVDFLEKLKETTPLPKHFILDNGPEFANGAFVDWCQRNSVELHFIDPGKPVQNAYIESFNGKFREEFLKQNDFETIWGVQKELKKWITYYNEERPHSSLDYLTPKEFADQETGVLEKKNNLLVLKTG
ncbi:MAG: IS3 family transposase [Bdellovibrio sp.]|nr:IS3 family transposase [Bdellovibrio sp.]